MQFWDTGITENTIKVLVIPNITNSRNIEKDSFVDVIYNHIKSLSEIGNYFWHIVLPKPVGKLNLINIKQHIVGISGDMINMRVAFPKEMVPILQELDYDVVYSHLPDWFMVARYTDKKIIGYSHWWEMNTCNAEDRKNMARNLPAEMLGVLKMDTCFLNTQEQKDKVLKEASTLFNSDKMSELESKLQVWNLGVQKNKIVNTALNVKEKIIVFNHRPAAYKGYPHFIELMEEYRKTRKDFTVWVPQLDGTPEFNWIDNTKVAKEEYYKKLQSCSVGVQMRQTNYGWSVAATDCMMNGTPMIYQESGCYKEIDPDGLFFKFKKDFFKMLDTLLDNVEFRKNHEIRSLDRARVLADNDEKMIKILNRKLSN